MSQDRVVIEHEQVLSQSQVWQAQRQYYDQSGIDAWAGDVPCYITTNPFIASRYATVVAAFIDDWRKANPSQPLQPFYCVEIGAGHGQFGFYFLKKLQEIMRSKGEEQLPVCYLMTDFTASNIDFWNKHPALTDFIEQGVLDFAQFDFENDDHLKLIHQQRTLSKGDIDQPMIVFANYLFDSIVTDVFKVNQGQLEETCVSLSTSAANMTDQGPKDWEQVDFDFTQKSMSSDYYQHDDFDALLNSYRDLSDDTQLQFPIGSLRGLENLKHLANGQLLLLSSDKGYVSREEIDGLEAPEFAIHGSFSLMVNFHALGEYCKSQQGDCQIPFSIDGFVTGLFLMGMTLPELPLTQLAQDANIMAFGPAEFFCFYEHMEPIIEKQSLKTISAYLSLSRWDPYIYEQVSERINELVEDADADLVQYLTEHLPKVAEQFYFLPDSHDILFDLAVYFHEAEDFHQAIVYYEQSSRYFDPTYALHFNWGYSLYHAGYIEDALRHFQSSLEFEADDPDAKEWVQRVTTELQPV